MIFVHSSPTGAAQLRQFNCPGFSHSMVDLSALACGEDTGPDLILSGGMPPTLWLPEDPLGGLKAIALNWHELKRFGARLIANAGDKVPPLAVEYRIEIMRDLVEKHGSY